MNFYRGRFPCFSMSGCGNWICWTSTSDSTRLYPLTFNTCSYSYSYLFVLLPLLFFLSFLLYWLFSTCCWYVVFYLLTFSFHFVFVSCCVSCYFVLALFALLPFCVSIYFELIFNVFLIFVLYLSSFICLLF